MMGPQQGPEKRRYRQFEIPTNAVSQMRGFATWRRVESAPDAIFPQWSEPA
jgi:hypothetical protein